MDRMTTPIYIHNVFHVPVRKHYLPYWKLQSSLIPLCQDLGRSKNQDTSITVATHYQSPRGCVQSECHSLCWVSGHISVIRKMLSTLNRLGGGCTGYSMKYELSVWSPVNVYFQDGYSVRKGIHLIQAWSSVIMVEQYFWGGKWSNIFKNTCPFDVLGLSFSFPARKHMRPKI